MVYIDSEKVLKIIGLALDDKRTSPIYSISHVYSIIYESECINGEISVNIKGYTEDIPLKFEIYENSVLIFREIVSVAEGGNLKYDCHFLPVFNIIDLAEILKNYLG